MAKLETVTGQVAGVYLTLHGQNESFPSRGLQLDLQGIHGDRHCGYTRRSGGREPEYPRGTEIKNDRQVSLVSEEELLAVAIALGIPELDADLLEANIEVRDIPHFTQLPPGSRLFFPAGAVLRISGENSPCIHPGKNIQRYYPQIAASNFPKASLGKRGLVGYVERAGQIYPQDSFVVEIPKQTIYSIPKKSY